MLPTGRHFFFLFLLWKRFCGFNFKQMFKKRHQQHDCFNAFQSRSTNSVSLPYYSVKMLSVCLTLCCYGSSLKDINVSKTFYELLWFFSSENIKVTEWHFQYFNTFPGKDTELDFCRLTTFAKAQSERKNLGV